MENKRRKISPPIATLFIFVVLHTFLQFFLLNEDFHCFVKQKKQNGKIRVLKSAFRNHHFIKVMRIGLPLSSIIFPKDFFCIIIAFLHYFRL